MTGPARRVRCLGVPVIGMVRRVAGIAMPVTGMARRVTGRRRPATGISWRGKGVAMSGTGLAMPAIGPPAPCSALPAQLLLPPCPILPVLPQSIEPLHVTCRHSGVESQHHVSVPTRAVPRQHRDLVVVSAGLDLDGGGRALAGRLLARTCVELARERGTGCEILTLGRSGAPGPARYFGTNQRGLALAAWRRQLGRSPALVFDLLGPARVQSWLPGALRAPYLLALHGIEVWHPLGWERRRSLVRAAIRLAFSRYTVERARPFCPDVESARIVPLALEERAPEGAVDLDLVSHLGTGFLLIVGRMASGERYKGHDQVFEILPRVPGARLVVAGDGDDRPRLEGRAADLGLQGRVTFTGFTSEATLAELYRRAAVFVMPSLGEGFGLVYLEAMRAGKPCVAARGSAAEEVVADRETGFLVDRDDPEELAAVLDRLLASPDLARRMGEAGRTRWREQFSLERFQEGVKPLLQDLLSPRATA